MFVISSGRANKLKCQKGMTFSSKQTVMTSYLLRLSLPSLKFFSLFFPKYGNDDGYKDRNGKNVKETERSVCERWSKKNRLKV